jgi:hypothetical protein
VVPGLREDPSLIENEGLVDCIVIDPGFKWWTLAKAFKTLQKLGSHKVNLIIDFQIIIN